VRHLARTVSVFTTAKMHVRRNSATTSVSASKLTGPVRTLMLRHRKVACFLLGVCISSMWVIFKHNAFEPATCVHPLSPDLPVVFHGVPASLPGVLVGTCHCSVVDNYCLCTPPISAAVAVRVLDDRTSKPVGWLALCSNSVGAGSGCELPSGMLPVFQTLPILGKQLQLQAFGHVFCDELLQGGTVCALSVLCALVELLLTFALHVLLMSMLGFGTCRTSFETRSCGGLVLPCVSHSNHRYLATARRQCRQGHVVTSWRSHHSSVHRPIPCSHEVAAIKSRMISNGVCICVVVTCLRLMLRSSLMGTTLQRLMPSSQCFWLCCESVYGPESSLLYYSLDTYHHGMLSESDARAFRLSIRVCSFCCSQSFVMINKINSAASLNSTTPMSEYNTARRQTDSGGCLLHAVSNSISNAFASASSYVHAQPVHCTWVEL